MAGGHDHPAHPAHPARSAAHAGRVPFWMHQLVELLLGILLLVQGARNGEHTALLVAFGGALLLFALCSDGGFGAWPWIGHRLHRALDLVAAALLAVSPLVAGVDHLVAVVVLELVAATMVWLALRTAWRPRPERAGQARRTGRTPPPEPRSRVEPTPAAPAVPVARKLGAAVGRVRDDGPRRLGRLVGRAKRAAQGKAPPECTDAPSDP